MSALLSDICTFNEMNSKMNGEVDEMMEVVLDKVVDEEANKKSKI